MHVDDYLRAAFRAQCARLFARATYYKYMIADFHNDFLTSEGGGDLAKIARETECCVCAVYTGGRGIAEVRRIVGRFRQKREKNLYLSLEDASYLDESTAEEVCGWEPVCVSLTSNGSNALAGGCLSDGGLTARGRKAVQARGMKAIVVDPGRQIERIRAL